MVKFNFEIPRMVFLQTINQVFSIQQFKEFFMDRYFVSWLEIVYQ